MFSTSYQSIIKVLSVLIGYACITFNQSVVLLLHHINRWCYHATCTHSGCIFKCPCGPWRASTRSNRQDVVSSISWLWSCKSTNRRLQWRWNDFIRSSTSTEICCDCYLFILQASVLSLNEKRNEKRRLPCYWPLATSYRILWYQLQVAKLAHYCSLYGFTCSCWKSLSTGMSNLVLPSRVGITL